MVLPNPKKLTSLVAHLSIVELSYLKSPARGHQRNDFKLKKKKSHTLAVCHGMLKIISVIHNYFFSTDILLLKQHIFRRTQLRNFYSCRSYFVIQYVMNFLKLLKLVQGLSFARTPIICIAFEIVEVKRILVGLNKKFVQCV